MRILALGFALPNASVDNYNALTAPSYYDYDAMIVDPESITRVARELVDGEREFEAFDGRPVVNFASSAAAVSAADQFRRRAEEAQRMLENGGLIIVMARPNATWSSFTSTASGAVTMLSKETTMMPASAARRITASKAVGEAALRIIASTPEAIMLSI